MREKKTISLDMLIEENDKKFYFSFCLYYAIHVHTTAFDWKETFSILIFILSTFPYKIHKINTRQQKNSLIKNKAPVDILEYFTI